MTATAVASCPCIPDQVLCAWLEYKNKLNWNYFATNQMYLSKGKIAPVILFPYEEKQTQPLGISKI